jgi:uncharacterized protein (DUF3084 family)
MEHFNLLLTVLLAGFGGMFGLILYLHSQLKNDFYNKFESFEKKMEDRFAQINQRFTQIDQRFEQMDQRFEKIDQRFEKIESIILDIDRRLCRVEGALSSKDCCMLKEDQKLKKAE